MTVVTRFNIFSPHKRKGRFLRDLSLFFMAVCYFTTYMSLHKIVLFRWPYLFSGRLDLLFFQKKISTSNWSWPCSWLIIDQQRNHRSSKWGHLWAFFLKYLLPQEIADYQTICGGLNETLMDISDPYASHSSLKKYLQFLFHFTIHHSQRRDPFYDT